MRLIDADKLKTCFTGFLPIIRYEDILTDIDNAPTIDAVEVVRCKDCANRYYDESRNLYYCTMYYGLGSVYDENYCSFGDRKR